MAGYAQGESFEEFRRGLLNDFNSFKNRILDHYADFLEGEWHEYETLMPKERYAAPKPERQPEIVRRRTDAAVDANGDLQWDDSYGVGMREAAAPARPVSDVQVPPVFDIQMAGEGREGKESVLFHGMEILVPQLDFEIVENFTSIGHFAYQWRKLKQQDVAGMIEREVLPVMNGLGLNDHLKYQFLSDYIDMKFPEAGIAAKMSVLHYLLANLGYDVRVAIDSQGTPLLGVASEQALFGVPSVDLDGRIYYLFAPAGLPVGNGVRSCNIPAAPDMGEAFDYRLGELNLPVREGEYDIEYGDLHLKGKVNLNLFPLLYHYPQMEISAYAQSNLQPGVRADIVRQVREQLGGKDKGAAIEDLLNFTQMGFGYATDHDYHGFEKPYFFEENLYYPLNDCEDRALFYTYLLWNALGVEAHLLSYPEHESASVAFPVDIAGKGYRFNGKRFYISDPTFLNAHSGECMPAYTRITPVLDYRYPSD